MSITWQSMLARRRAGLDSALSTMVTRRERALKEHEEGRVRPGAHENALASLDTSGLGFLLVGGPALAREQLEPLAHVVGPAVPDYIDLWGNDEPVRTGLLDAATAVCIFQCLGIDIGPDPLPAFRPCLVRVDTRRSDLYVWTHWDRALVALVVDDRRTWGPIAGLTEKQKIEFRARATFQFNMQGLIAHLAGALAHRATLADVEPAWRDYVHCFPELTSAKLADHATTLWIARLVFHHIGGQPLGEVATRMYEAIVAEEGSSR